MTAPGGIDPALVLAAQRGDGMAKGELMEALIPFLGRVCGPIALQDGPDAVQEALIAILRNLGQLRDPAAIFGWAKAIAVREAILVARQAGGPPRRSWPTFRQRATRSWPPTSPTCSPASRRSTGPS